MTPRQAMLLAPTLLLFGLAATGAGQEVIDSIDVGGAWVGSLAYNSTADVVYGLSQETYYFFAISCESSRVISRIYRDMPVCIAYDSADNKAYFTQRTTEDVDSVIVVDGQTHRYLRGIPLPWAGVPLWDAGSDRLYISCDEEDEVGVIDCRVDTLICRVRVGQGPTGLDINTQRRKLYVRNWMGESVSIVDMQTSQVIRTIPMGGVPEAGCYHSGVDKYYCGIPGEVVVICGAADTVTSRIHLPSTGAVHSMVAVGPRVMASATYQSNGWLHVLDAQGDSVVSVLGVGREPMRLAHSLRTGLVYCANSVSNSLSVVSEDGSRLVATLPVGGYPFALLPVPYRSRLYVGHLGSRKVYVLHDTLSGISEPAEAGTDPRPVIRVHPSPFAKSVTIECGVRLPPGAGVSIYSEDGQQRKKLAPSRGLPGTLSGYVWDGTDSQGKSVPPGVYLAVVEGKAGARAKLVKLD